MIPNDVIERHPRLRELVESPERFQGTGNNTKCSEGLAAMDDLQAAGAQVRVYDEISRDTYILLDSQSYLFLLTHGVRD